MSKANDGGTRAPARTMMPAPVSDEEALEEVLREVEQIARRGAPVVNVDVQVAAQKVKAALADLREDVRLYERVKAQAAVGEFDFDVLDRLQRNGPALWLLGHRARVEREQSARLIDEATLNRATYVRAELGRIATYHFGRDPLEGAAVLKIGNSIDHQVLANDLRYLHDLCVRRRKKLEGDANLTPDLLKDARRISDELLDAFGDRASTGLREADRVAALWSVVKADHDALLEVLRYLLRATPDRGKARFPRLVGGPGRSKRTNSAGEEDAVPEEAPGGGAARVQTEGAAPGGEVTRPAEPEKPAVATPTPKRAAAPAKKKNKKSARGKRG